MEHPDGSVESLDDPDFWWAVLGGGGGVFGVVTQFVLKLHPAPDGFVNYVGQWPIALDGTNCTGVATEVCKSEDCRFYIYVDATQNSFLRVSHFTNFVRMCFLKVRCLGTDVFAKL